MASSRPRPREAADREAAAARAKRRRRKAALLAIAGAKCSLCPDPAVCLVAPDASGYLVPSRAHSQGPSDHGLTAAAGTVFAMSANRTPMCRPCQSRTARQRLQRLRGAR